MQGETKEPSEKFLRALDDLKQLIIRGGLAQDKTPAKAFETQIAFQYRILKIGMEEGLTHEFIMTRIQTILVESNAQKLEDVPLLDILRLIIPAQDREDNKLPHDREFAKALFNFTIKKYYACSEQERRKIMRSDAEFYVAIKEAIIRGTGFKNESDAFGVVSENPSVPKLKRGNELFWILEGDPEPEDYREVNDKLKRLAVVVIEKFRELYPNLWEKLGFETLNLVSNTSNVVTFNALNSAIERGEHYFNAMAVPLLVNAVLALFVERDNYVNPQEKENIRETMLKTLDIKEDSHMPDLQ